MAREFPWGRVIQTHVVGPYTIIEYAERGADNHPTHPRRETGRNLFSIGGEAGSSESFASLDMALVGSIARRRGEPHAAYFAGRVLGITELAQIAQLASPSMEEMPDDARARAAFYAQRMIDIRKIAKGE